MINYYTYSPTPAILKALNTRPAKEVKIVKRKAAAKKTVGKPAVNGPAKKK